MNRPEYVKVDDKLYKINTDFRVALECNRISTDSSIGDYERSLAILYKLFGDDGLTCENKQELIKKAMKYILFNQEEKDVKTQSREKYELDFDKCEGLIRSSFKFDYNYDPYELEYLHYYDFYNDLSNLSTSEFGNCCILNRVTGILNQEASEIKDTKQQRKLIEAQRELRKMYCVDVKEEMTEKEKNSVIDLYKQLGLMKGDK